MRLLLPRRDESRARIVFQLAGQPLQQVDQLGLLRPVQRRQQSLVGLFGGLLGLRQDGRSERRQHHRDAAFVAGGRRACQQPPRLEAAQDAQHGDLVEAERARQARLAETGVRPQYGEHTKLGGRQCQLAALVLENGGGNLVRTPQQETGAHIELRQAGWRRDGHELQQGLGNAWIVPSGRLRIIVSIPTWGQKAWSFLNGGPPPRSSSLRWQASAPRPRRRPPPRRRKARCA